MKYPWDEEQWNEEQKKYIYSPNTDGTLQGTAKKIIIKFKNKEITLLKNDIKKLKRLKLI